MVYMCGVCALINLCSDVKLLFWCGCLIVWEGSGDKTKEASHQKDHMITPYGKRLPKQECPTLLEKKQSQVNNR